MFFYYIAEANEALIITGAGAHSGKHGDVGGEEEAGFKIVVGKGAWAIPFFQKVRRLGLQAHTTVIQDQCVTNQGIPVDVKGVVVFKVGDDFMSIANAARRFLENESEMDEKVHNVFAGHLRSIIGGMTVEEIIGQRNRLAEETRKSSETEMQKLGLVIDSLQIQEVEDPTGYIENIAAPHQAAIEAAARIAKAERDREATEREQEAEAQMAQARSASQVRQAQLLAQSEAAKQESEQAGPLAAAKAQMAVVEQQTKVAELEAARTEQQLQVEIVKPAQARRDATIATAEAERRRVELEAEAEAAATRVRAQADAEATRLNGVAKGDAKKAELTAEADGLKARAEALAANQDAVIQQQIAEQLPEIVRAAAEAFGSIGTMTVLNGADGVGEMFAAALATGLNSLPSLMKGLSNGSTNGVAARERSDDRLAEAR
jgi:uncharacterized membrane protein YqiK